MNIYFKNKKNRAFDYVSYGGISRFQYIDFKCLSFKIVSVLLRFNHYQIT